MDFHQILNVWTPCLIQPARNCFSKYALLVIVCMIFYHLLVASIVICGSVLIDLFYYNATVIFTTNLLLTVVYLKDSNFVAVFYSIDIRSMCVSINLIWFDFIYSIWMIFVDGGGDVCLLYDVWWLHQRIRDLVIIALYKSTLYLTLPYMYLSRCQFHVGLMLILLHRNVTTPF